MSIDGKSRSVFNLQKDPLCQKNIASNPQAMKIIEKAWLFILKDAGGSIPDYRKVEKTDALGEKY